MNECDLIRKKKKNLKATGFSQQIDIYFFSIPFSH